MKGCNRSREKLLVLFWNQLQKLLIPITLMARRSPSVPFRGNRDPEFGLKLFYVEPEFYSDGPIVTITEEDITGENEF